MSQPGRGRRTVAFFGEDANDCDALSVLFAELRPDLSSLSRRKFRKPLTLVKGIDAAKLRARSRSLTTFVSSMQRQHNIVVAVLHEDADAVEPAHEAVRDRILAAYGEVRCVVVAAVPAWEMESWWFLFPRAVALVNASWRVPDDYTGRDTGKIANAKEVLVAKVRPRERRKGSARVRDYEESDSPKVARNVVALGIIDEPVGTSMSWRSFVEQVRGIVL